MNDLKIDKLPITINCSFHFQAAIDDAFRNEAKISDLFKVKANLKALIFTCLLVSFQQCSGINVVLFYMGSIFQAAHSALPDSISTIIVGVVQTATSGITPLICDKLGRRMLLITSGIGEIVSLVSEQSLNSIFISRQLHTVYNVFPFIKFCYWIVRSNEKQDIASPRGAETNLLHFCKLFHREQKESMNE